MLDRSTAPIVTCLNALNRAEVLAAMLYPCDEERRRHYLAGVVADLLNVAERHPELHGCAPEGKSDGPNGDTVEDGLSRPRPVSLKGYLEERRNEAGGYGSYVDAIRRSTLRELYSTGLRKWLKGWCTVGYMMDLIHRMAVHHPDLRGGASVLKARYIVKTLGQGNDELFYQGGRILDAWSDYKPVRHLCAAYFVIAAAAASRGDGDPAERAWEAIHNALFRSGPRPFLELAENYLRFGLGYQAPRSDGPLLDPNETLIAEWPTFAIEPAKPTGEPIPITGASQFDLAAGPLSAAELEVADAYRADRRD